MLLDDWLVFIGSVHCKDIELGLDRVREVGDRLGVLRPGALVVTVGGTNGKGSTVAGIEAVLCAADVRVGCYSSPHLFSFNERFRVQGARERIRICRDPLTNQHPTNTEAQYGLALRLPFSQLASH